MDTQQQLQQAFSDALGIPAASVTDDLTYNTIPEWDSTAHMILIAELENVFDVMLDTDDIIDMSSVAQAKLILQKYDVSFG
ncbi:acyl carrier protein [Alteromonas lipolytica]|uniref:Acyl carrier protein n=1 Tax=Alteromonas lipolytica TaxID=1856405 RepID=A0A1E8FF71_9ALTE|nr:acyl carrier protein [Alteromonas lipolytica]OFI34582.1 acyl carrier protein [Alteromonas lipolytica]GGF52258.1 acyl carrier protein [Alteromonas lipolytica]